MAMAKRQTVKAVDLGAAVSEQLGLYHEDLIEQINAVGAEAVESLVQQTKATAPKRKGKFRRRIASQSKKDRLGNEIHVWYVKSPEHRLTHLLVHGHATRNGGRVKGDPFLHNALDKVLPEYERKVEEVIRNG